MLSLLVKTFPFLACIGFAGALRICFKTLEQLSKQTFKRQLARAIETSSIFTVGTMLPGFCITAFDAIFTDNLWSIRGFIRSCIASVVIVTILLVVWYSSIPDEWHLHIVALGRENHPNVSNWFFIATHVTPGGYDINIGPHGELTVPRQVD
jgi:hypothetical protein